MEVAVDWRAKVELFEQLRREYEHGVGTIRGVARKFGAPRWMVREDLGSALLAKRKQPERRCPKLGPVKNFIEAILETDRKAPRKQRRTAHRIYEHLKAELPHCDVSESTVRRYVGRRKTGDEVGGAENLYSHDDWRLWLIDLGDPVTSFTARSKGLCSVQAG